MNVLSTIFLIPYDGALRNYRTIDAGAEVTTVVCVGACTQVREPESAPHMGEYEYFIVADVGGGAVEASSLAAPSTFAAVSAEPSIEIA
jgi:hypothetical protein